MEDHQKEAGGMPTIMPQRVMVVIAVVAFGVLSAGLVVLLVQPDRLLRFESPMGRLVLALAIAFHFAVFMSVIYAQEFKLPIPWLHKTVMLGGPAALTILVAKLLLGIMPDVQPPGRFYRAEHSPAGPPLEIHLAQVHTSDSKVHAYLAKDLGSDRLTGIYVDFGGRTGPHTITLQTPGLPRPPPVEFIAEPGYGEGSFDATLPNVIE